MPTRNTCMMMLATEALTLPLNTFPSKARVLESSLHLEAALTWRFGGAEVSEKTPQHRWDSALEMWVSIPTSTNHNLENKINQPLLGNHDKPLSRPRRRETRLRLPTIKKINSRPREASDTSRYLAANPKNPNHKKHSDGVTLS